MSQGPKIIIIITTVTITITINIVIIIVMGCLASVVCRPGAECMACYGWRVGYV